MINARSSTQDRRASAPQSWARPPTSSRVVAPSTASQPARIVRTSKTSHVAAQAPDPRSHAGQRRSTIKRASSAAVAGLADAQAVESPARVIGILMLLEVPAGPQRPPGDPSEDEETWLAS